MVRSASRRIRWPALNGARRGRAAPQVLGPDVEIASTPMTRPIAGSGPTGSSGTIRRGRWRGAGRPGRRAVEPVSARGRSGAAVSRRRHPGVHRRVSRLGLPGDAARDAARIARGAATRHLALRRRGRGGRLDQVLADACAGALKPIYNHMNDLPGLADEPVTPILPIEHRPAHRRDDRRSFDARARLPVPVQLLHDHQRAGPQEPLPHADDRRADHPREPGAGHLPVLHHRRQFRAQPNWEAIFDRLIEMRESEGLELQLHHPGRHAVPPHPELHREGGARRRARGSLSGSKTSTPTICWRPRNTRTRSPNTARCCSNGASSGVITYAGYILGFPGDTQGVDPARHRDHQARIAGRHPRILFPDAAAGLGGPPEALHAGVWMDPDLNKYDLNHRVVAPSQNVGRGMGGSLPRGLGSYYTPEHVRDDPAPHCRQPARPRRATRSACSGGSSR